MHPTILKNPSFDGYSLDVVTLTPGQKLPPMPAEAGYISQNVLFGPDAAVEIKDGQLKLFMMGAVTSNPAFNAFVYEHEEEVVARANSLIKHPSDVVVFVGKWYHVDYDMEPLFRPYIIRVDRADGTTQVLPSKDHIFWTDEDNEYFSSEVIDGEELGGDCADVFRSYSEQYIRRFMSAPFSSGFYSWGGFLWHPTVEGFPIVYVPLEGVISHRKKHDWKSRRDLDPHYLSQYKAVDPALVAFKKALEARRDHGDEWILSVLSDLNKTIDEMPGENERADMRDYVVALLGDQFLDERTGYLEEKSDVPETESITLKDVQLRTKAKGYWVIGRDEKLQRETVTYLTFLSGAHHDDEGIALDRCSAVPIEGFDKGCTYASDWVPYRYGTLKYLAFGPEMTLSW